MALWWKVVTLLRFCLVKFQNLQPHSRALRVQASNISDFILVSMFLLEKKCLVAPNIDLAFLILALIWRSLFSSSVIILPRFLKLLVKWTRLLSGKRMSFVGGCLRGHP